MKEGHGRGDYSVRLNIEGFFWTSRELMGIEAHMFAFYDRSELLHDINEYILSFYLDKLVQVLEVLPADIVYIMEDLSGKNGSMISPSQFDEFIGRYLGYKFTVNEPGGYKITEKFAEVYATAVGQKKFNIWAQDQRMLKDYDIYASVGHDTDMPIISAIVSSERFCSIYLAFTIKLISFIKS